MNTKPSHTPWETENVGTEIYVNDGHDVDICHVLRPYPSRGEAIGTDAEVDAWQSAARDANARLIVRAVNAHDDLLAALESCPALGFTQSALTEWWDKTARAAIAKARGESATR